MRRPYGFILLGIAFVLLGSFSPTNRAFIGVGAAFMAIGIVRSRQRPNPPQG